MKRAWVFVPIVSLIAVLVWRSLRSPEPPSPGAAVMSPSPPGPPALAVAPIPPVPPPTLRGGLRVSVYAGGAPVEGARVELLRVKGIGRMDFLTLPDGTQLVNEIPEGDFGVTVRYKLLVPRFAIVKVTADKTAEIRFDLLPGGLVSGIVVDRSGNPVPKTLVEATRPTGEAFGGTLQTETNAEGRYRLEGVPLQEFGLHAWNFRYMHWTKDNLRLRDPSDFLVVDVILDPGSRIGGRVVSDDGKPVGKAQVVGLNEATYTALSDEDGRFVLYGLGGSPVAISVSARGFGTKFVDAVAPETSDLVVVLQKGGAVSGRLDASPEPHTFAVFLASYAHRAGKDVRVPYRAEKTPDGGFLIRDVEPGIYRVEVEAPGYETLDKPAITLTSGTTESVAIRLKKSP